MRVYEADIRERQNQRELEFSEVERYRNTVNAINECMVNATIFNPESFGERLNPISPDELTPEAIEQKYKWLNGNVPHDRIEQALMISHQMAMATQVLDDWRGRDIDQRLNIPSFAMAALLQTGGNERQAWKILKQQKEFYKQRAQGLGLAYMPAKGALTLFGGIMRFQRIVVRYLEKHPDSQLHKRVTGKLKLRERLAAQRRLGDDVF